MTLCRDKINRDYFALKVLAIQDIIKLKQVDHVKNEKNILSVGSFLKKAFCNEKCLENQSPFLDKVVVDPQRQAVPLHVVPFYLRRRIVQVEKVSILSKTNFNIGT